MIGVNPYRNRVCSLTNVPIVRVRSRSFTLVCGSYGLIGDLCTSSRRHGVGCRAENTSGAGNAGCAHNAYIRGAVSYYCTIYTYIRCVHTCGFVRIGKYTCLRLDRKTRVYIHLYRVIVSSALVEIYGNSMCNTRTQANLPILRRFRSSENVSKIVTN